MFNRYAPISKMENMPDGTVKVWGIASTEAVDSDGEVIKADAMKNALPEYMQWGAVREMHQPIAAGTCLEAAVDEEGRTIICAHIVDEGSVKKVKANVLKGFSIGGTATGTELMNKSIITSLTLNEISLVDKPANPEAVISLWKADKMNPQTQSTSDLVTGEQLGNEIEAAVKGGTLSLAEVMAGVQALVKAKKEAKTPKADEMDFCPHGVDKGEKCEDCEGGVAKGKFFSTLLKRYFTEEERHDLATSGKAMPDGSYPIENEEDLKNAIKAYGRSKDPAATKKHIEQRAKELGKEDLLPTDWDAAAKAAGGDVNANKSGAGENTAKVDGAVAPAGGTNAPAGNASTEKSAKAGSAATSVAKTQSNADVPAVGMGTTGAPNAVVQQQSPGTSGTFNPQAKVTDLPAVQPKIGDLVSIKWGEDEVSGEITELGNTGQFVMKNGDAWLAADSSKLTHHELIGDKVNWIVTQEDNAAFTAAKGTDASKAAMSGRVTAALQKMCAGGAGKSIQKGMWTVSDWAATLQSIFYLMKDIKWESMSEDDEEDDSMEKRIAMWLNAGGQLMLEYAADELKEMFTGIADPDNICEFVIELAAKPGELKKFAAGETGVGHALKKAFGGNLDADAVNNAISKAVSTAVEAAVGKLEKAHTEKVAELTAQIEKLRAEPVPMRGVTKMVAVSKDGNLGSGEGEEVAPVKKSDGSTDEAATAIKKSFSNPQQFTRINSQ